jgi:hypothetical protein
MEQTSSKSAGAVASSGVASLNNPKLKKSLSVVEAENGYVITEHFNGLGGGGQHIAADLDAANEIIKAYFAKE